MRSGERSPPAHSRPLGAARAFERGGKGALPRSQGIMPSHFPLTRRPIAPSNPAEPSTPSYRTLEPGEALDPTPMPVSQPAWKEASYPGDVSMDSVSGV